MHSNLNTSCALPAPELQAGTVLKRSKSGWAWNRRWLALRGRNLYLSNAENIAPKRVFSLDDIKLIEGHQGMKHSFTLLVGTHPEEKVYFAALSATSREVWVSLFSPRLRLPALSVVAPGLVRTPTSLPPPLGPQSELCAAIVAGDAFRVAKLSGRFMRRSSAAVKIVVDGGTYLASFRISFARSDAELADMSSTMRALQLLADAGKMSPLTGYFAARIDYRGQRAFCTTLGDCSKIVLSDDKLAAVSEVLGVNKDDLRAYGTFLTLPDGGIVMGSLKSASEAFEYSEVAGRSISIREPYLEGLPESVDARLDVFMRRAENEASILPTDSDSLRRALKAHGINCCLLGAIFEKSRLPYLKALVACDAAARVAKNLLREAAKSAEDVDIVVKSLLSSILDNYLILSEEASQRFGFSSNLPDLPTELLTQCISFHCGFVVQPEGISWLTRVKAVSFREISDSMGLSNSSPLHDKLRLEWAAVSGTSSIPQPLSADCLSAFRMQLPSFGMIILDASPERFDLIAELLVSRGEPFHLLLAVAPASPCRNRLLNVAAGAELASAARSGKSTTILQSELVARLEGHPSVIEIIRGVAENHWKVENYDEARNCLETCLAFSEESLGRTHALTGWHHVLLGNACRRTGGLEIAVGHFDQARIAASSRQDVEGESEASLYLARALKERGDYNQAAIAASRASQLPGDVGRDALVLFGICCELLGRTTEAFTAFSSVYEYGETDDVLKALTRLTLRKAFETYPTIAQSAKKLISVLPGHSHEEKAESLGFVLPCDCRDANIYAGRIVEEMVKSGTCDSSERALKHLLRIFFWANPEASIASKTLGGGMQRPSLVVHTEETDECSYATVGDLRKLSSVIRLPSYNSSWLGN